MSGAGHAPPPTREGTPLVLDDALAARLGASTSGAAGAPPLVLLLDVDGTLAPIAPRPDLARVPERTRAAIERLAGRPGITVALVSGRGADDARRLVDVAALWTIGNHGVELLAPDGTLTVDPRVAPYADAMRAAGEALAAVAATVPGAALEDKRWTLTMHYRLAPADAVPALRLAMEREAARHGFVVTEGKAVLELRPPVRVDKGTASIRFLERIAGAVALFAGDDLTDEDAFRALREAMPGTVTVRVGEVSATHAEFVVPSTDDVRALLEWIATVRP